MLTGIPERRECELETDGYARRLSSKKPVGKRVAHLHNAGNAPYPLWAANLALIPVRNVSPSQDRNDDMDDDETHQ